jgi:hypothetical protein
MQRFSFWIGDLEVSCDLRFPRQWKLVGFSRGGTKGDFSHGGLISALSA